MKKVNTILTLIFLYCIADCLGANPQKVDTFLVVWNDSTQNDSIRTEAFSEYIWQGFLFSEPDSASRLANELISFSKKKGYLPGEALGLNLKGISRTVVGNYPKALEYYKLSLKIREKLGDKSGISASLNNIGLVYNNMGNNTKALDYYERSLKIYEETGNKSGVSANLGNIGIIYFNQENYQKALEYFEHSLKINREIDDKRGMAGCLMNIGNILSKQENYAKALDYEVRALKLFEEIGTKNGISKGLNSIGRIYHDLGNYPQALNYYKRGLIVSQEIGDNSGVANCLNNIGATYRMQVDYTQAIKFCNHGLELAQLVGNLGLQKASCECLYETYKTLGQGNKALVYLEKINLITDSLNKTETIKKLQQMEFAKQLYQDSLATAEKERLVQEAHQEEVRQKNQTRNVFIGASFFLLLVAGGLFSRWRYMRKSRNIISKEKDRSENLLLNILPAEIAEELKLNGKAQARDFDMVSILFTDFKGFTEQSAKLSAAELVNEINHCFEAFDAIIEKYGIEKIKTIGDAYMAAGGLPVPSDDSVKNTVLAALEMQDFIAKRKFENEMAGKIAFEMRVGIHTGPVVAGIVGVKKFQYDIWGDTVNTASRMESNGEVDKVNISKQTYELIKNNPHFRFKPRGKIDAKGKGEMEMYFVDLYDS